MAVLDLLFYTFIVVVSIQVFYYIFIFGRFAFLKVHEQPSKNLPVSIIICAKNEAENLQVFLPSIISQDYQNFEIVLINDASKDKTLKVINEFKASHQNIKVVDVISNEAFWGNKKYALTLGIKASSHDTLIFTDADCKPVSNQWLKEMTAHFDTHKSIVLGYGTYAKVKNSFLNKLIRYETLITAIQYFSFAKIGIPYMGVGRNLAYTKKEFFDANGFITHMKVRSGDDDLFINQVANSTNTTICFSPNSFTESLPKTTYKSWFTQKRRHVSTAKYYKGIHKFLLALIYISKILFWILAVLLLLISFKTLAVIALILFMLLIQYIIVGCSSKKLGETDVLILLPILEIFLIVAQLTIFIKNLISKPNHWK
ncbi:glycosyltransferase [Changchengzhania lutea]|uniref:glycosyltransferase n=1 Tax=Changchengzhania lutea TaxID=2049305 RepID=UPI00115D417C|nr:glycosyltransferase [Changchengzhania lutea]